MSQCSERVKHAVPPPFVSSGLFLLPAPAERDSRPSGLLPPAPGDRAQGRNRDDSGLETGNRGASAPSPCRPAPSGTPAWTQAGSGQYLCGYIDIIYSLSRNRYYRIAVPRFISVIRGFCGPHIPFPAIPYGFATPDPFRAPKAHKLVTNYAGIAAIRYISLLALRLMHR
jgi:hypothetical protein